MKYKMEVLNEREKTHGDYSMTAEYAQRIKSVTRLNPTYPAVLLESLDLISTKLARIVSGNPYEKDHWKDIAGYANLVSEFLEMMEREEKLDEGKMK